MSLISQELVHYVTGVGDVTKVGALVMSQELVQYVTGVGEITRVGALVMSQQLFHYVTKVVSLCHRSWWCHRSWCTSNVTTVVSLCHRSRCTGDVARLGALVMSQDLMQYVTDITRVGVVCDISDITSQELVFYVTGVGALVTSHEFVH